MTPLTYADYLHVDTLLSLQATRTPDTAGRAVVLAEHFFIVTHQSCELWLKQITIDLDAAADAMTPPYGPEDEELALEFLQRVAESLRVLHDQLVALEKLPLRHFAEFRPFLDRASGAQSAQFRLLTRMLGDDRQEGGLYRGVRAPDRAQRHQRRRRLRAGPRRRRRRAQPHRRQPPRRGQRLLAVEGDAPGAGVEHAGQPHRHRRQHRRRRPGTPGRPPVPPVAAASGAGPREGAAGALPREDPSPPVSGPDLRRRAAARTGRATWYLLWALLPLAATANRHRERTVLAAVSTVVALVLPPLAAPAADLVVGYLTAHRPGHRHGSDESL